MQGRPQAVHPYPPQQISSGVMQPVTNPVHAGQPKHGAVATPPVKKANKKPGCIKKLSHKSQVFQRSDCGTLIISGIRIALAVTSITAVTTAFAALSDNVEDVLSVIDTWRAPPLLELRVVASSTPCPTGNGWTEVSALTWPGASRHSCACPAGARSPDNGFNQASTPDICDGNQTLAGCEVFPSFPSMPVKTYLGNQTLCGRFDGTPFLVDAEDLSTVNKAETTGEVPRPVPDASGACPTNFKVCGAPPGSAPDWDENRAVCFDNDKPCPVRWFQQDDAGRIFGSSAVIGPKQGDAVAEQQPAVGDTVLLYNASVAGGGSSEYEVVQVGPLPTDRILEYRSGVSVGFRLTFARAANGDLADSAVYLVRSTLDLAPTVLTEMSLNGEFCFGTDASDDKGFAGPGSNGGNSYTDGCARNDPRWVTAVSRELKQYLPDTLNASAVCASSDTMADSLQCNQCRTTDYICRALSCVSACENLKLYGVAGTQITTHLSPGARIPSGAEDAEPKMTLEARRQSYWSSDCVHEPAEFIARSEPLQDVRDQQGRVVVLVTILSFITIGFAVLQLGTLNSKGLLNCPCCIPCAFAIGMCKCGATDKCQKDRITQRVVLAFYATVAGLFLSGTKVLLVTLVTLRMDDIRSFYSTWEDPKMFCTDEDTTNLTLQRLGETLESSYSRNLLSLFAECILLLGVVNNIIGELTDGEPLCQKGKPVLKA